MSGADVNTSLARILVDEWVRAGVHDAVVAPGSRSAPLALALAADGRIRLSVFLDERSAAFFALGTAKVSGRPAVVLCTSGTAAANFHPAVIEAWHGRVPLIVCTADRPPELRDTGAGQTIDQIKLYGDAVRWFVEVGAPEDVAGVELGRYWRAIGSRSCAVAVGPPAGPVHLNLAFREPLVPTGQPLVATPGRPRGAPWVTSSGPTALPHADDVTALAGSVDAHPHGVLVAGWGSGVTPATATRFARAAGWPILADTISGLRTGPLAISTYDPLLRSSVFGPAMPPEIVLQIGAPLTNRPAREWLERSPRRVLVDPHGGWLDPDRSAHHRVLADPEALLSSLADAVCWRGPETRWLDRWTAADRQARAAVDGLLDTWESPFEGRVVRDIAACLPDGSTIVVGSSMPVRDAESFVAARTGLRWLANRGANGIDGFVSTVLGVARSADEGDGPVVGLFGDLTLLHDAGALAGAGHRDLDAVLVVLDNDGGGIFSFLPQAGVDHFEKVFGTPHGLDLVAVAEALGVSARRVKEASEVVPALLDSVKVGGVRLIVVPTDRDDNVTRHRDVWRAVADGA